MTHFLLGTLALIASTLPSMPVAAQRRPTPTSGITTALVAPPAGPVRQAAEGTFQLIALTDKRQSYVTTEALTEIEARRHDTQEVRWNITPYTVVRILPRRVIEAPGFKPVPVQVPYQRPARGAK